MASVRISLLIESNGISIDYLTIYSIELSSLGAEKKLRDDRGVHSKYVLPTGNSDSALCTSLLFGMDMRCNVGVSKGVKVHPESQISKSIVQVNSIELIEG